MLVELHIRDFAIIDQVHLRFGTAFNVLSGETGAGKSIIIDALGTLRGEKTDPSLVRAGAERARIEGIFSVADDHDLHGLLQEYGLLDQDEDQLIISREISAESGRSVARINGRAVNVATLREIGSRLIDIHGQHEGLALFQVRTHLEMLDRYGGLVPLRARTAELHNRLRHIREELAALRREAARRVERIAELNFLIEDVGAAKLRPGEDAELLQERQVLQNSARVTDLVASSYGLLYAGSEEGRRPLRPVVELIAEVADQLGALAAIDPHVSPLAEQALELRYALEELAAGVRTYRDNLEFDPRRLDAIEDRLTLIRSLERKYGGTVERILERAAHAREEIERLTHSDEQMAALEAEEHRLVAELGEQAAELSRRRRSTGDDLAVAVEGAMRALAMPHVRFHVEIAHSLDPHGVALRDVPGTTAGTRYACDRTGADQVEFLLSPNPGEPLKPLARIASGGESARLLLALKSILSAVDSVPTLVFDEVDVGVGGRAGQVVGERLWGLTNHHQVLCITHLPQVAAFADTHFVISKQIEQNRTRTQVRELDYTQRTDELAAMLDGTPISEHSRNSAGEMLERAAARKGLVAHG